jgi:glycosyltransferase involved in cell wall biosynthesis
VRVLMLCKACIVGIYQRKLEAIAQAGVELRVLVPPSWRDERGEQMLEAVYTSGYDLRIVPIVLNGNFHLHFYRGIADHIADFAPDIVHIDEEPYNLASWQALYHARQQGAKTLFFSWQNIMRRYPPPFSWGENWLLRHVDYALMGTQSAADVWRDKGYTGDLAVVPQFGTDLTLFQPRPHNVTLKPFTLGFIGRMVEEKGVHDLLEALAGLKGDWHLRMVGGGNRVEALQTQAQSLGIAERITWVGQIASTAMPAEYQKLDALVLPSRTRPNWKEQFGRVLIEAMASGVPVVGSDSGAIPDVIGNAGRVFPEGDVEALRTHLHRLLTDEASRQQLRTAGITRAREFTHEAIAQATIEAYRTMLGSA